MKVRVSKGAATFVSIVFFPIALGAEERLSAWLSYSEVYEFHYLSLAHSLGQDYSMALEQVQFENLPENEFDAKQYKEDWLDGIRKFASSTDIFVDYYGVDTPTKVILRDYDFEKSAFEVCLPMYFPIMTEPFTIDHGTYKHIGWTKIDYPSSLNVTDEVCQLRDVDGRESTSYDFSNSDTVGRIYYLSIPDVAVARGIRDQIPEGYGSVYVSCRLSDVRFEPVQYSDKLWIKGNCAALSMYIASTVGEGPVVQADLSVEVPTFDVQLHNGSGGSYPAN